MSITSSPIFGGEETCWQIIVEECGSQIHSYSYICKTFSRMGADYWKALLWLRWPVTGIDVERPTSDNKKKMSTLNDTQYRNVCKVKWPYPNYFFLYRIVHAQESYLLLACQTSLLSPDLLSWKPLPINKSCCHKSMPFRSHSDVFTCMDDNHEGEGIPWKKF